jgi:diadenosine tetraphosphate (Ap4A) HIT family hydrolase
MTRLEAAGICLFCPAGLRESEQPILLETSHWTVTLNAYPYPGTAFHALLVPHQHASDMLDLGSAAQHDFWSALATIRERHDLTYYGLGVRNGDCRFTGGTIAHVHAHLIVADPTSATEVPVRMRFSSRPSR